MNKLIEEAILQAELSKVKVLSLGLSNQASPFIFLNDFYLIIFTSWIKVSIIQIIHENFFVNPKLFNFIM